MRTILAALLITGLLVLALAPSVAAQGYIELDPIVVEGRIQRPEAAYIIQRAQIEFGMQAKKRSFLSKVEESIDGGPF
ncbi:MAG: hypothetical protein P9L99_05085 [Candidatus Lernaella stagnicola]|nr:hypothetical protein [Candidatus Lernaella stagnicola]